MEATDVEKEKYSFIKYKIEQTPQYKSLKWPITSNQVSCKFTYTSSGKSSQLQPIKVILAVPFLYWLANKKAGISKVW